MSRIWRELFSKNGLAAKEIARILITVDEGNRIPRIEDFAQQLQLGRGTVQGALKILENLHAVTLESRGHLGTFLIKRDLNLLKEVAGTGQIMGAMPLPYSILYEGLATGLIEVSESLIIQVNLAYMRGSKQRIKNLKARRYDFVVLSKLAADEEIKNDQQLDIALTFNPNTFVTSHKVFLADIHKDGIEDGMRVGIDPTSYDQKRLTMAECYQKDVEFVQINYMQVFDHLKNGSIDATVWNSDDNGIKSTFKQVDFQSKEAKQKANKATSAAILIEKDRQDIMDYFQQLNKNKIEEIQQLVVQHKKIPHY